MEGFPIARKPAAGNSRIQAVYPGIQSAIGRQQLLKDTQNASFRFLQGPAGRAGSISDFSG